MDVAKLSQMIAQGNALASVLVPAVQTCIGLVLQIATAAKARGWDIDTRQAEETAALFDSVVSFARAEKAKYQGKEG